MNAESARRLHRRSLAKGVVWSVPAVAVAMAAPRVAASAACTPDLSIANNPTDAVDPYPIGLGAALTVIVTIQEVLGCDSCNPSVRLSAPVGWALTYDPSLTSSIGVDAVNYSVDNTNWSVLSSSTTTVTVQRQGCIAPNGSVLLSVDIEPTVAAVVGSVANYTSGILADTGVPPTYDSDLSNNSSSTSVTRLA